MYVGLVCTTYVRSWSLSVLSSVCLTVCDVIHMQVGKGLWKVVRLPNDVLLETKRMRDMELW